MILILAAVPLETQLLRAQINAPQISEIKTTQIIKGGLKGQDIFLAHSGIGLVNMTITTSQLLSHCKPDVLFLIGCGGSYPNSGLRNGDLVVADSEIYGDLGVETDDGFLLLNGVSAKNTDLIVKDVHQKYMFNKDIINFINTSLPEVTSGACVSVNCCSGTLALSQKLEQRTGGLCENMEGAAAAQVCAEANIPMVELRGISNPAGSRDPGQWELRKGALSAEQGLLNLLEIWPPDREVLCPN